MCIGQSPSTRKKEWTNFRVLQKETLEKKFKRHFMSALEKNKSAQTNGSVFAERIEKAKRTKFELELIKIVDCFLDGHSN